MQAVAFSPEPPGSPSVLNLSLIQVRVLFYVSLFGLEFCHQQSRDSSNTGPKSIDMFCLFSVSILPRLKSVSFGSLNDLSVCFLGLRGGMAGMLDKTGGLWF